MLSALIGLLGITPLPAAPVTTATIGVTATVPDPSPQMEFQIWELTTPLQGWWTGTNVTLTNSMSFGQLTYLLADGTNAGLWYAQKYFAVILYTTGFGKGYQVTSSCSGLTSGGNSLPAGSFGLTPVYAPTDKWVWPGGEKVQGAQPSGSTLGTAGPAVTGVLSKLIYQSETAGSDRIIQAYYSLPPFPALPATEPFPGFTPIPLSQPTGTYTGQVTLTIAAI